MARRRKRKWRSGLFTFNPGDISAGNRKMKSGAKRFWRALMP